MSKQITVTLPERDYPTRGRRDSISKWFIEDIDLTEVHALESGTVALYAVVSGDNGDASLENRLSPTAAQRLGLALIAAAHAVKEGESCD